MGRGEIVGETFEEGWLEEFGGKEMDGDKEREWLGKVGSTCEDKVEEILGGEIEGISREKLGGELGGEMEGISGENIELELGGETEGISEEKVGEEVGKENVESSCDIGEINKGEVSEGAKSLLDSVKNGLI